jgi:hypothetical protein
MPAERPATSLSTPHRSRSDAMTTMKTIAAFVLFDIAALSAYALYPVGLQGLIPTVTETNMVGHVFCHLKCRVETQTPKNTKDP